MNRTTIRKTLGKELVRPSQRSSVETPGTAGSRGTGGPLFSRSSEACPGNHRLWWAAGTVITRNPTRSRPDRRQDTSGRVISKQYKPQQLRGVIGTWTWNTRSMRTIGKLETVESGMERMKIGWLGLSETRWTGKVHFVSDAGSTVIYSGTESRKESGVAMILDKERSRSFMGYNPVNSRILSLRLSGRPWNFTDFEPRSGLRTDKPGRRSRESKLLHLLTTGVSAGTKTGHRPVERRL